MTKMNLKKIIMIIIKIMIIKENITNYFIRNKPNNYKNCFLNMDLIYIN